MIDGIPTANKIKQSVCLEQSFFNSLHTFLQLYLYFSFSFDSYFDYDSSSWSSRVRLGGSDGAGRTPSISNEKLTKLNLSSDMRLISYYRVLFKVGDDEFGCWEWGVSTVICCSWFMSTCNIFTFFIFKYYINTSISI